MPSYRNEWIPFRSNARTDAQIAHPPSAKALFSALRVNHNPRCGGRPSSIFFVLVHFKTLPSAGQEHTLLHRRPAFILRILAGTMTPRQKSTCQESSAIPGLKDGTAVDGELLHLCDSLVHQKLSIESTGFAVVADSATVGFAGRAMQRVRFFQNLRVRRMAA